MGGKRRIATLVAAAVTVVLMVGGCSTQAPDTGTGSDGVKVGPGVTDDTIRIGNLLALSGPTAVFGEGYAAGLKGYFDKVNAEGGIAGRTVELVNEDSGYDPQTALTAYRRIRDDVLALGSTMGSPVTDGIRQVVQEDQMFAVIGGLNTTYAGDENLLIPGGTYRIDATNAIGWYMTEGGGQEGDVLSVLYQDDTYGQDVLQGLRYAAEYYGIEIGAEVSYATTTTDFTPQVTQLKDSGADLVFTTTLGNTLGPYLTTADRLDFAPPTFGSATSWSLALKSLPQDLFVNYRAVGGLPIVGVGDDEAVKTMTADIQESTPDATPDMVSGLAYLHGALLTEVLRNAAENKDLTRAGVLAAAADLAEVDTGGLVPTMDFTPVNGIRVGLRASRLFEVDFGTEVGLTPATEYFASDAAEQDTFENLG